MPDTPPHTPRVLVVDDCAASAKMLAMVLKISGFESHIAVSGIEALEVYPGLRPHAVLLDLDMPGMDGFEVCRRIRRQPDSASILIVIVSGHGHDDHKVQAIEAGANYYFVKPADPVKLLLLIQQHGSDE